MPTITPDVNFQMAVFFESESGNSVFLRTQAVRVYEMSISPQLTSAGKIALQQAWDFCSTEQASDDLIHFAHFLAGLPMFIQNGYVIPKGHFMESPFSDPEYYTFLADYFLYCVFQRPAVHINTSITIFPPALSAEIVIDAILEYRKDPKFRLPDVPLDWEKHVDTSGWTRYVPSSGRWGGMDDWIWEHYTPWQGYWEHSLRPEFGWIWKGQEIDAEGWPHHILNSRGIRKETGGRLYYWGTDDPNYRNDFPLSGYLPHPNGHFGVFFWDTPQSRGASFNYRGVPDGGKEMYFPPTVGRSEGEGRIQPPGGILPPGGMGGQIDVLSGFGVIKNFKLSMPGVPWSRWVDGSWTVGMGGIRI